MTVLVIVESPSKAKKIASYLGSGYDVRASVGHIRDLPNTADAIPQEVRSQPWTRIGINVDDRFKPLYVVMEDKKATVAGLRKAVKAASEVLLATDEDREGESIAWHLAQELGLKPPVKRMVFHEITRKAILEAVAQTRPLDMNLVNAQEARRAIDRLAGFEVSPLVASSLGRGRTAGRVQSAALSIVVARERARMRFVAGRFARLEAKFQVGPILTATLHSIDRVPVATAKDFDPGSGALKDGSAAAVLTAERSKALADALPGLASRITRVERNEVSVRPPAPFTTAELQMEAHRKLKLGAERSMKIAQALYEAGLITYMRTDSPGLSEEATLAARARAVQEYGEASIPEEPRRYAATAAGAQEAHEAIRPTGDQCRPPEGVQGELRALFDKEPAFRDALALYTLIYRRTVASQMVDARLARVKVVIEAATLVGRAEFTATGRQVLVPGFRQAYEEGQDDEDEDAAELPAVVDGTQGTCLEARTKSSSTQPPGRFTQASLLKEIQRAGIGRPSTYSATIGKIIDPTRAFVRVLKESIIPTFTGMAVVGFLEGRFPELVNLKFTAQMERSLDEVAAGKLARVAYLQGFYFGDGGGLNLKGLVQSAARGGEVLIEVPKLEGSGYAVYHGSGGAFLLHGTERRSLAIDVTPDDLTPQTAGQVFASGAAYAPAVGRDGHLVGVDPSSGEEIRVRDHPEHGPYVRSGARAASLPAGVAAGDVTVELALSLFEGREGRSLGEHNGVPVLVKLGKTGLYVKNGEVSASLPGGLSLREVTREQALTALEGRLGRLLGTHGGQEVRVYSGKFGAYVKCGVQSGNLGESVQPGDVTLEQGVAALGFVVGEIGGQPVLARTGQYGVYAEVGGQRLTIRGAASPQDVTLDQVQAEIQRKASTRLLGMIGDQRAEVARNDRGPFLRVGRTYVNLSDDEAATLTLAEAKKKLKEKK